MHGVQVERFELLLKRLLRFSIVALDRLLDQIKCGWQVFAVVHRARDAVEQSVRAKLVDFVLLTEEPVIQSCKLFMLASVRGQVLTRYFLAMRDASSCASAADACT